MKLSFSLFVILLRAVNAKPHLRFEDNACTPAGGDPYYHPGIDVDLLPCCPGTLQVLHGTRYTCDCTAEGGDPYGHAEPGYGILVPCCSGTTMELHGSHYTCDATGPVPPPAPTPPAPAPTPSGSSKFYLQEEYSGSGFFGNFNFYTGSDPTHGYVDYISESEATTLGLMNVRSNGKIYIGAEHEQVVASWQLGRKSVRIESKKEDFNGGLFMIDLEHMPVGCGTWPAFWTVGRNWPYHGEIDIIEQVNSQNKNHCTLHTSPGCSFSGDDPSFTGHFLHNDCDSTGGSNDGCGILGPPDTFGPSFNDQNGGVFATYWTSESISTWFFRRGSIPDDISASNPDPSSWGLPWARFYLGPNCPPSHFIDQRIVINLTFCGDWAGGGAWPYQCPGKGNCNDYVANNPSQFSEAYWLINYVKVFQPAEVGENLYNTAIN